MKVIALEGTNKEAAKKLSKSLARAIVEFLRGRDIQLGVMDKNWEPTNHLLSAEENKRCWNYLALQFVKCTLKVSLSKNLIPSGDVLFNSWLSFLQDVNNVIKCGYKDKLIERIIDNSGIPETTWVRFLD